ncbi:MAG: hypothetical protein AB7O62_15515, partial [Pirellulales bacterium]
MIRLLGMAGFLVVGVDSFADARDDTIERMVFVAAHQSAMESPPTTQNNLELLFLECENRETWTCSLQIT